jgi:predicted metal-dependent peptidase
VEQKGAIPKRTIKIGLAIDTSGSVSDTDFKEFISEIKGIQKCYKNETTVMECDAAIQKVYTLKPYSKLDTKFKGRGGTDYEPVFKKIQDEPKYQPELLIYFTDFYCTFPKKAPRFPVLWVVCTNGDKNNKPPFGAVIRMKKKAPKNGSDDE